MYGLKAKQGDSGQPPSVRWQEYRVDLEANYRPRFEDLATAAYYWERAVSYPWDGGAGEEYDYEASMVASQARELHRRIAIVFHAQYQVDMYSLMWTRNKDDHARAVYVSSQEQDGQDKEKLAINVVAAGLTYSGPGARDGIKTAISVPTNTENDIAAGRPSLRPPEPAPQR